ncbi:glycerophosphodiester phosphodiesterase [Moniliophthora roreri]|nr:glycerophosphodiester phosphodiesterase [Moniliophthora roreri]
MTIGRFGVAGHDAGATRDLVKALEWGIRQVRTLKAKPLQYASRLCADRCGLLKRVHGSRADKCTFRACIRDGPRRASKEYILDSKYCIAS